jgi:hypothetical protein
MIELLFILAWISASLICSGVAIAFYRWADYASASAFARLAAMKIPQDDKWYMEQCRQSKAIDRG